MLTIYFRDAAHAEVQVCNDAWFRYNLHEITFDDTVVNLIKTIEKTEYYGNYQIAGKFDGGSWLHVSKLSTGCKTAINVYAFPNEVFSVIECGPNALGEICKMQKGNIELPCFLGVSDFENNVCVITSGNKYIIKNHWELIKLMKKCYIRSI